MVDNLNPSNQFHPYLPVTDTPNSEKPAGGLSSILKRVGINPDTINSMGSSMKNTNMSGSVEKVRGYAQKNPGAVLGGLAAVVIGLGMLRGRR